MGTDIHAYAEYKTSTGWVSADGWTLEPGCKHESRVHQWMLDEHRDYAWFAFLADVRNGAGIPHIQTTVYDRCPEDADPRTQRSLNDCASRIRVLTLAELKQWFRVLGPHPYEGRTLSHRIGYIYHIWRSYLERVLSMNDDYRDGCDSRVRVVFGFDS